MALPQIKFDTIVEDYEIMMHAVHLNGIAIASASLDLKDNEEIIKVAMKTNCWAFEYASKRIQSIRSFALQAVQSNGEMLKFCPDFQDDEEIVKAGIQENGVCIKYASERIKNKREIGLLAVQSNGCALEYLSEELRNDKGIALIAISKTTRIIQYLSQETQDIYKKFGEKKLIELMLEDSLATKSNQKQMKI